MPSISDQHLSSFESAIFLEQFAGIRRGLEKEGLRVNLQGEISQQNHPQSLGSALTHPHITTDYSEALLEFITPALDTPQAVSDFLYNIHAFTQQKLDNELIWGCSMPCHIANELDIRIAEYGSSNIGQLKHVYRHGLWHRYGRLMQSIAGIHYNYSMPESFWSHYHQLMKSELSEQDFRSERYFALIRNFKRFSWLLIYLFGASPAIAASFVEHRPNKLIEGIKDSLYAPKGTSLRMSDLGYQNSAQSSLTVCYNSLENYIHTLSHAVQTPHGAYQQIGIQKDNQFMQLNTNLLQIENEFYSDIRPKRTAEGDEKPLQALSKRGVEYIEVRCLDINPFKATGIDHQQICFMDTFLTFCLLADSPEVDPQECQRLAQNLVGMAYEGANPDKQILLEGRPCTIASEGQHVFKQMLKVARLLDQSQKTQSYTESVKHYQAMLTQPDLLPSQQQIQYMQRNHMSFQEFGLEISQKNADELQEYSVTPDFVASMEQTSHKSLQNQSAIEKSDNTSFFNYLENFSK